MDPYENSKITNPYNLLTPDEIEEQPISDTIAPNNKKRKNIIKKK